MLLIAATPSITFVFAYYLLPSFSVDHWPTFHRARLPMLYYYASRHHYWQYHYLPFFHAIFFVAITRRFISSFRFSFTITIRHCRHYRHFHWPRHAFTDIPRCLLFILPVIADIIIITVIFNMPIISYYFHVITDAHIICLIFILAFYATPLIFISHHYAFILHSSFFIHFHFFARCHYSVFIIIFATLIAIVCPLPFSTISFNRAANAFTFSPFFSRLHYYFHCLRRCHQAWLLMPLASRHAIDTDHFIFAFWLPPLPFSLLPCHAMPFHAVAWWAELSFRRRLSRHDMPLIRCFRHCRYSLLLPLPFYCRDADIIISRPFFQRPLPAIFFGSFRRAARYITPYCRHYWAISSIFTIAIPTLWHYYYYHWLFLHTFIINIDIRSFSFFISLFSFIFVY